MRGIFTLRNLLYVFLIVLLQATALQAASQNNNPTTCSNSPGGCGEVDETFNINNGGFSSPANNFTWTNDFNNWRAALSANNTYTITSGLYTVGALTTANIGFAVAGSGGDDISSYTINIRNVNGALLATCGGTFTTVPPDGTALCRTLDDLDIQNQTVRVEFVFTADGAVPANDTLIFNDFRTNLTVIAACNSNNNICPSGVTEDFDDNDRGDFTASANGFVYNPGTGGNGFFELPDFPSPTYSNRTFSLISGRYQVATAAFTVTTGFDYDGGLDNDVETLVVNLRDDANNILSSCTFIRGVNENANQICLTLNNANLVGRVVRVEFVFDMDENAGGNLQFDNFRINLPEAIIPPPLPVDFTSFTAQKAS
ncbi:MAG TPA: hypothetical protein VD794_08130, partial [Flavisolibacter sp.]|nr:hypothetical protein [Flavisolibacter sp.]